jgi:hypothetical protein
VIPDSIEGKTASTSAGERSRCRNSAGGVLHDETSRTRMPGLPTSPAPFSARVQPADHVTLDLVGCKTPLPVPELAFR